MAKKKAFAKGGGAQKSNVAKGIFKVNAAQQKKKPKAVKTQIKKVKMSILINNFNIQFHSSLLFDRFKPMLRHSKRRQTKN